jgi:hypothetical protein
MRRPSGCRRNRGGWFRRSPRPGLSSGPRFRTGAHVFAANAGGRPRQRRGEPPAGADRPASTPRPRARDLRWVASASPPPHHRQPLRPAHSPDPHPAASVRCEQGDVILGTPLRWTPGGDDASRRPKGLWPASGRMATCRSDAEYGSFRRRHALVWTSSSAQRLLQDDVRRVFSKRKTPGGTGIGRVCGGKCTEGSADRRRSPS